MLSSVQINTIFHRMKINFADYDYNPEYSILFPMISEFLMKLSYRFDCFTTTVNLEALLEEIYKEIETTKVLKWNEEKENYKRAQYFFCTLVIEYILVARNLFENYNTKLLEIKAGGQFSQTKEKQELAFQLFNWIAELFYEHFNTKNTQGICLRVAERLEGLNQEYVKGGGEKEETAKRVELIRNISGIPKAKRAPCKRNHTSSKQQKKSKEESMISKNFNPVFSPEISVVDVACGASNSSYASNNYLCSDQYSLSDEEASILLNALETDPREEAAGISSGSEPIESIPVAKKQRCDNSNEPYQHNYAAISVEFPELDFNSDELSVLDELLDSFH